MQSQAQLPLTTEKEEKRTNPVHIKKAFILFGLAGKSFNESKVQVAIKYLDQAIELFPYYVFYYYRADFRFRIAISDEILKLAEADYEACVKLSPEFTPAYIMAAHGFLRNDKQKHLLKIIHLLSLHSSLNGMQIQFRDVESVEFNLSVFEQATKIYDFLNDLLPTLLQKLPSLDEESALWKNLAETVLCLAGAKQLEKIKTDNNSSRLNRENILKKLRMVNRKVKDSLNLLLNANSKYIKCEKTQNKISYTFAKDKTVVVDLTILNNTIRDFKKSPEGERKKKILANISRLIYQTISCLTELHDYEEAYYWAGELIKFCPDYVFYINRGLIIFRDGALKKSPQSWHRSYEDFSHLIKSHPEKSFAYLLRAQLNLLKYSNNLGVNAAKAEAFADMGRFLELGGIVEDLTSACGNLGLVKSQQENELIKVYLDILNITILACFDEGPSPIEEVLSNLMMLERLLKYMPSLLYRIDDRFFSAFIFYLKNYEEDEQHPDYLLTLSRKLIEISGEVLKSSVNSSIIYYFSAKGYFKIGKFQEALPWIEKAIQQGALPFFYYLLGRIYWELGKKDEAANAFEQSLGPDSINYRAALSLMQIYSERGDFEKAKACLKIAKKNYRASRELNRGAKEDEIALTLIRKYSQLLNSEESEVIELLQAEIPAPDPKPKEEKDNLPKHSAKERDIKKIHQRLLRIIKNNLPASLVPMLADAWFAKLPLELVIKGQNIYLQINLNADFNSTRFNSLVHPRLVCNLDSVPHLSICLTVEEESAIGLKKLLASLPEILQLLKTQLINEMPLLASPCPYNQLKRWLVLSKEEQTELLSAFTFAEILSSEERAPSDKVFSLLSLYPYLPITDIVKIKKLSKKCDEEKVEFAIHGSFVWLWVAKLLGSEAPFETADIDFIVLGANSPTFKEILKEIGANESQRGHKYVQYKAKGKLDFDITIREDNTRSYDPIHLARHKFILKAGLAELKDEKEELKTSVVGKLVAVDLPDPKTKATCFFARVIKYSTKAKEYKLDASVTAVLADQQWHRQYMLGLIQHPFGNRSLFLEFVELIKRNYLALPVAKILIRSYLSLLIENLHGHNLLGAVQGTGILENYVDFVQYLAQQDLSFFTHSVAVELYLVLQHILLNCGRSQGVIAKVFPDNEFQDIKPPAKQLEEPIVTRINMAFKRFQEASVKLEYPKRLFFAEKSVQDPVIEAAEIRCAAGK